MVEPALCQVPLNQVHPLPTGCTCTAGGLLFALLGQAVWGEVITLQGMGYSYQPCCSWLSPPFPNSHVPQMYTELHDANT